LPDAADLRAARAKVDVTRKLSAEFLGTAGLLTVVVGSGIMGERLAGGNAAVALLANSIAIGAGLIVLIYGFGNISEAHFNPAVTITAAVNRDIGMGLSLAYSAAQFVGAAAGVVVANLMFELPAVNLSTKTRSGAGQFLGEFVATFGLIGVIAVFSRFNQKLTGVMVACYITAACWFTSSTSFANPAVTAARSLSNTFAGIDPANVPMFILAQLLGAFVALLVFKWLTAREENND
jgi:glycerol uptake facilitator-like aquaporin